MPRPAELICNSLMRKPNDVLKWFVVGSGHFGKWVDVHSALGRKSNSTLAVVHHFDGLGAKADVARTASICSQRRLDEHPERMRQRRETVEHPFGTIKARMGATHFLMKTLPRVASEMALHVLAYNLTRVMNIMGTQPLMAAMRA